MFRKKNKVDPRVANYNLIKDLQNDINLSFDDRIVAIFSADEEKASAEFALEYAKTYAEFCQKTLIIDANMYEPQLLNLLKSQEEEKVIKVSDDIGAYCLKPSDYPSEFFKNKELNSIIKNYEKEYRRFVVIVPNVNRHKDILLIKDIYGCSLLVAVKNKTKRSDIYYASQICKENGLKLARVVLLNRVLS